MNILNTELNTQAAVYGTQDPTTSSQPFALQAEFYVITHKVRQLSDIDFSSNNVAHVTGVDDIHYNVGRGSMWADGPKDDFAARFTGSLLIEEAGAYTFWMRSDDGSKLTIGDETLGNDGLHSARTKSFTIQLEAGAHDLEALYFERGGHAVMEIEWSGPDTNGSRTNLNASAFATPGEVISADKSALEEETGSSSEKDEASTTEGINEDEIGGSLSEATASISLDEALTNTPFDTKYVAQAYDTDGAHVINIESKKAGGDRGVWTFTDEEGWTKLTSDSWKKYDAKYGKMHATDDGDIYMVSNRGAYKLEDIGSPEMKWVDVPGLGRGISGDLAANNDVLYTLAGEKHSATQLLALNLETQEVTSIAIDRVGNKAGRADLWMNDEGALFVKDDRGRYSQIDTETGKVTQTAWLGSDLGLDDRVTTTSLADALENAAPFNIDYVAQTFETNGAHVVNISSKKAGADRGIWTFNDEEGWSQLRSSSWGKYDNQTGDLHVTQDGDIYVANGRGVFHLEEAFGQDLLWVRMADIDNRPSGDLAGDDQFLYTFAGGKHVVNQLKVIDLENQEVHTIDIDPVANKAGRADLRMDADGTLIVRDDRGRYFEIDRETGEQTRIVDEAVPDIFEFKTEFATLTDGPGAATPFQGKAGWTDMSDGLKAATGLDYVNIDGMTMQNGDLYVIIDNPKTVPGANSAIFRFDGDSWDLVTSSGKAEKGLGLGYGMKSILAGDDGILYVQGHHVIFEVNTETGNWKNINATSSVNMGKGLGGKHAEFQDGKLFVISSTRNTDVESASGRAISVYDAATETWTHLPINHEMDRKPHISLMVDDEGNIWFRSNYSGIFRADLQDDGSYAAFEKVHDRSGKLYEGGDGEIYLSYEVTKYTQIASTFRFDTSSGEEEWIMTHQDRGYGIDGVAVDGTSVTFQTDGRFGENLISGSMKWDLPDIPGTKSAYTVSDDGIVFVRAREDGGQKLLALDVLETTNNVVPYDADLKVDMARNLVEEGAPADAQASGLEILGDGKIAVATTIDGEGEFTIYSEDGLTEEESFDLGEVRDMDANPDGSQIAIATEDGLMLYNHATGEMREITDQNIRRVDMDDAGNIAYVVGKTVTVLDAEGDITFEKNFGFSYMEDVALDAESGLVYIVGFSNQRLPDGLPVQGPHLRAYDIETGDLAWSRFEFGGQHKSSNIADARLYNVEIGEDGELYIMGESAGTQTIFRYDGTRLDGEEITTKIDHANDLWNTKSAHVAYHARLDKDTGDVMESQMTMSRLQSTGTSNTYKVGDIAADADGRVYIGGENAAYLMNRDGISINGIDVPDYDGSDPSFMALSRDFDTRLSWHSLDQGGAKGRVEQVATRDGKTVLLTEYDGGELFTTTGNANEGGSNVNLAIIQSGEIYQPRSYTEADPLDESQDLLAGLGAETVDVNLI